MAHLADSDGIQPTVLRPRFGRQPSSGERSEAELVTRVRGGDDAAFEALYDAYHRRLLAFCQHMLGSREEAEDALQHTFLAAYRSLRAGYEVVDLKPWLYTIARNRCVSVIRARREEVELDECAPATEGLSAEVDRRAELRMLVHDVQRLPPDQRAALVLFEVGDHSHKEIAAVLGVRCEKVKALVFQARQALMGWRTARETPCAHVREQLASLRSRELGRATIRRHVELCSGCADYEAAVRSQRAALAIALPVAPAAAGLRAAVLGSVAGGSGLGAAVGATGATSAAGGLAGLGVNTVAAKFLLVTTLIGGAGVARHATADQAQRRPAVAPAPRAAVTPPVRAARLPTVVRYPAQPGVRVRRVASTAPAEHAAAKVEPKARRGAGGVPPARSEGGKAAATTGKAAAPGQLKAPGTPAHGKALGQAKAKAHTAPPARQVKARPDRTVAEPKAPKAKEPKAPKAKAVEAAPAKPPKAVKGSGAPEAPAAPAAATPAAAAHGPGSSAPAPPGQAKKQDGTAKKP